jgi:hypothetical protein
MSTWQMLEYLFDQIPYMATIMVAIRIVLNFPFLGIPIMSSSSFFE